jgi:replicative DNA helicase
MSANYATGGPLFDQWREKVTSGKPPVLFPVAAVDHPLRQLEIGPEIITTFGGPPGSAKTALAMQMTFDAVALTPSLKAVVANVEMPPEVLLDRQLARLSGIPLRTVRYRQFTDEHADRLADGLAQVKALTERIAFVRAPFDLANVAATADATGAELIVLDYVQRIGPPREYADKRLGLNAVMDAVRGFADAGCGVVVVSAVGRQKDTAGKSSYDNLTLASFRESSELEYGTDSAYLIVRDDDGGAVLKCVKNRHGDPCDIALAFDGDRQSFDPPDQSDGRLSAAVAAAWGGTPEGGDDW